MIGEETACPSCHRIPEPGEDHEVLVGVHGPDDSPEPEYVCLDADLYRLDPLPVGDPNAEPPY